MTPIEMALHASTAKENRVTENAPLIAQKNPFGIDVEAEKAYYWCSCGRSTKQPFCDGSHQGSSFAPIKYVAETSQTVYFCGCKHSLNGPLCDGRHNTLP
jgi:CDGSH iron-sulfur domain-containing protein 3